MKKQGNNLEKRIDELMTLHRVSQTMNSSLNVKETLETVMDAVIEVARTDRALMYLMNEDRTRFIPTIARGNVGNIDLDFDVDPEESIFRLIVQQRLPIVVEDAANDKRVNQEHAGRLGTTSFALIPMIWKEQVVGIIGVDNAVTGRPVVDVDLDLLVTLANHAAIALSNNQMYEKTTRFNEELQQRVTEATEHLERLLEMKSHFLTVASHQLRTPTTVVKGLLSMLIEDPEMPDEERNRLIDQTYASVNRLQRIISELLTATELEDKPKMVQLEELHPGEIIDEIVKELGPLAEEKKITLLTELSAELPSIQSDRFKLYEAVANLVDNAIRYTQEGSVKVSVRQGNAAVTFRVEDTGIGIDPDEVEAIFEKFHRSEDALEIQASGTGLGLFITKGIIDTLQGEIQVDSAGRGKGSAFTIHVPVRSPRQD